LPSGDGGLCYHAAQQAVAARRLDGFVPKQFAKAQVESCSLGAAEQRRYASTVGEGMGTDSVKLFDKALADQMLAEGRDPLVALGDEEIYLDYWGSYAEVFNGHPEGSISSLDYLPDEEEETFLLLRPDHVDRMVRSLNEHRGDLNIMDKEQLEKLERWRDFCAANPSHMVAYIFDF
jgi:hypothetical protein